MEECFNTTIDIKHEEIKEKEKPTQNQKQKTTTGHNSSLATRKRPTESGTLGRNT